MKKHLFILSALMVILHLEASSPVKYMSADPDFFSGKPSATVKTTVSFECLDGYKCLGFDSKILRKDAPKEFFAIPGLPILKHRHPNYDSFVITRFKRFPSPLTKGQFSLEVPLQGYKAGDYAVGIVGDFVDQKGKHTYWATNLCITVTESDTNSVPFKRVLTPKFTAEAAPAAPTADQPVTFSGNFVCPENQKVRIYSCFVYRSKAPKAFFEQNASRVIKHAKNSDYDRIDLRPNSYISPPSNVGSFKFTPELKMPSGNYELIFQLYGCEEKTNKSFYRNTILKLSIK